ncbi:DNA polymerase iota isoform X1 [Lepisosteus oculatus]|uniref:Polymerase (DNA directed) iota n=1 Tax=Lepisosteus oculatus TaxID=7918 RepID=W5M6L7_LEPOC|nr:PREDICTED: DNA polymerase iota isoform X1 [Lepisosteus oculatus]
MEYLNPDDDSLFCDEEEDDDDWMCRDPAEQGSSTTSSGVISSILPGTGAQERWFPVGQRHRRVILHFDLDCFYAQVEMIRNPELRHKPLGIQQKNIVVTSNYVARECGVNKLMFVTDAKEKCPQLVLISGEDLTHYREMSYKVTELLEGYSSLVERLGFDENFVDITEVVEKKLRQASVSPDLTVNGNIYNKQPLNPNIEDHIRLAVGSQIAAEVRLAIHGKLGLTGCAGIATSKLLAKLVCGTFKPNQQTTLLPESTSHLMSSLGHFSKVPGVGYRTAQKLQALGLRSLEDLQLFPLTELEKEFGAATAKRIHSLSHGIDEAPVTPTGPPQSLSDEDSFKKVSTESEVSKKVEDLLVSLLERMYKDGRQPRTLRLTIRRFTTTNKWFSRESRQCPIPNHIRQKIATGTADVVAPLVDLAMKLFRKMIDTKTAFHLTLINVCFSNLQSAYTSNKGSIGFFFAHKTDGKPNPSFDSKIESCIRGQGSDVTVNTLKKACGSESAVTGEESQQAQQKQSRPGLVKDFQPPLGVDPEVFRQLPEEIQREIMSSTSPAPCLGASREKKVPVMKSSHKRELSSTLQLPKRKTSLGSSECKSTDSIGSHEEKKKSQTGFVQPSPQLAHESSTSSFSVCEAMDPESPMDCDPLKQTAEFPSNVDPKVFSELPAELQRELLTEWKQQRPVSKIHINKYLAKAKDTKPTTAKSTQTNNLLKYFKQS